MDPTKDTAGQVDSAQPTGNAAPAGEPNPQKPDTADKGSAEPNKQQQQTPAPDPAKAEVETLKARLAEFEKREREAEKAKMTEAQRAKAEADEAKAEAAKARKEADEIKAALARKSLQARLTGDGATDPGFLSSHPDLATCLVVGSDGELSPEAQAAYDSFRASHPALFGKRNAGLPGPGSNGQGGRKPGFWANVRAAADEQRRRA